MGAAPGRWQQRARHPRRRRLAGRRSLSKPIIGPPAPHSSQQADGVPARHSPAAGLWRESCWRLAWGRSRRERAARALLCFARGFAWSAHQPPSRLPACSRVTLYSAGCSTAKCLKLRRSLSSICAQCVALLTLQAALSLAALCRSLAGLHWPRLQLDYGCMTAQPRGATSMSENPAIAGTKLPIVLWPRQIKLYGSRNVANTKCISRSRRQTTRRSAAASAQAGSRLQCPRRGGAAGP